MGEKIEPVIFTEGNYSEADIEAVKNRYKCQVIDLYQGQIAELAEINYPSATSDKLQGYIKERLVSDPNKRGSWVYFPWSNQLLHIVNEPQLLELRTNRNQLLITKEETDALADYTVTVFGLSVGNSIAVSLAYSAVCGSLVLTDKDNFASSNLNRVRVSLADVGKAKTDVTARQIYELNPYARLKFVKEGVSPFNLVKFFTPAKNIIFEELDDFAMKLAIRKEAKKHGVPVVMLTNLGDNILVDIERYDQQPSLPILNGAINEDIDSILSGKISKADEKRLAAQIVGIGHVPTRALKSLPQIGKTLVGRPQLFSSVSITGGLSTYIVRLIVLGEIKSGRYFWSLSNIFNLESEDLSITSERQQILDNLEPK